MTGGRVLRGGIGWGADNDCSDVDGDEVRCLQPGPKCLFFSFFLFLNQFIVLAI